jgi:predicted metalloprotease with PDZ domain
VRNASAEDAGSGFWVSQSFQQLPYDKGMLVAAWLDYGIRIRTNETKDLDDILLAMQSAAAAAPDALATELLLAELQAGAGWDARAEIVEIDRQDTELQVLGQGQNGLTAEQQAALDAHVARRTALQAEVTRLEAKRDR